LRRWASVLIGEGKDSKQLSIPEEKRLRELVYSLRSKTGYITPKELRDFAGMGHTAAEGVLISQLLRKWKNQGVVEPVRRGLYRVIPRESAESDEFTKLLEWLKRPLP
jgi:predicted transcriptional regulator of viral defense system